MSAGTIKRGDDAADHAPRPNIQDNNKPARKDRQDAPNYDEKRDGAQALDVEDVSSGNDEGAG